MTKSLFFYDLETSGFNPRQARIMQFAGQRTDLKLNKLGDPFNYLIRLTPDVLPDPQAVLLTGITPQKTISDGISEAEFLKIFYSEIATSDTTFVGFNSVRFDDEFIRYLNYRNFYDPYEWEWKDGRKRWDLLDVVRMMRALRPSNVNWPVDKLGKGVNRLENLAQANKISHVSAHDALSDVEALIGVATLVYEAQPKLFDYLRDIMSDKKKISELVLANAPFVYCSGKYESQYEKTTIVANLAMHPKRQAALVFDLRNDPTELSGLSEQQLIEEWMPEGKSNRYFPIRTLMFNRCPAIAPMSVMDDASQKRLSLDMNKINNNFKKLEEVRSNLAKKVLSVVNELDKQQVLKYADLVPEVDERLYENFFTSADKNNMGKVVNAKIDELKNLVIKFDDDRLNGLFPLYKARNYPKTLNEEEANIWEKYRQRYLMGGNESSRLARYFSQLNEISPDRKNKDEGYLIDELKLYGESLITT